MKTTKEAMDYVHSFNARQRAKRPSALKHIGKVYVFSLYWHAFNVNLGHMGSYKIPALDRSNAEQMRRGYSDPLVLPEIFQEEYDQLSGKLGLNLWDTLPNEDDPFEQPGVIKDLLGLNSSQPGLSAFTTNRSWFGVFVAHGAGATPAELKRFKERGEVWDFPTQHELDEARQKLTQMMQQLYDDAENKALEGPNGLKAIQAVEREAAHYLGLGPDWCKRPQPQGTCPECQQPIQPGLPVHFIQQGGCGAVLDEEKVRRNRTPGYEHIWAPRAVGAGAAK